MRADDDGFISNPKKIARMINSGDDDLKVLLSKRFILSFDSGVIVIKHWRMHNSIQKDRYKETNYQDEKKSLKIKENGSYTENVSTLDTECIQNGNTGKDRLGKDRLGKVNNTAKQGFADKDEINQLLDIFYEYNPGIKYGNKTQRNAIDFILNQFGLLQAKAIIKYALSIQGEQYAPRITTPCQLRDKIGDLRAYKQRSNSNQPNIVKL
jgi:hypothetical protein